MSDERLLPCPFCGGEAYINYDTMVDERRIYWAQVLCKRCHARSCGSWSNSYTNAEKKEVKAWNTRKPMERIVEQLEQQKQQYKRRSEEAAHVLHGEHFFGKMCSYDHAIKIVKAGGVDETD